MVNDSMIQVKNLSKNYGQRTAIRNLNFSVQKGEIVGLLGPNGAGKTTTMKIITGFMPASQGCVVINGIDIFEDPIKVKQKIGYLPETPPVYGDMSVIKYLEFVAALRKAPRGQRQSQVQKVIHQMHLEEVKNRLIQNLSKGFRQRVGLAQALVTEPEILILDEPTVGLDPKQVAEIRNLILGLRGQQTVILSTHILSEVQATCEKVIIINKGEIVVIDHLESLSQRIAGHSRIALKVKRPERISSLESLEGVQKVSHTENVFLVDTINKDETAQALSQCVIQSGAGLMEMKFIDLNLEDIFIQLTSSSDPLVKTHPSQQKENSHSSDKDVEK